MSFFPLLCLSLSLPFLLSLSLCLRLRELAPSVSLCIFLCLSVCFLVSESLSLSPSLSVATCIHCRSSLMGLPCCMVYFDIKIASRASATIISCAGFDLSGLLLQLKTASFVYAALLASESRRRRIEIACVVGE